MFGHFGEDGQTVTGVMRPSGSEGLSRHRRWHDSPGERLRDMLQQLIDGAGARQNQNILDLIDQLEAMHYDV